MMSKSYLHDRLTSFVSSMNVKLAHLELVLEFGVLFIQFDIAQDLDILDALILAPLEGLQQHQESIADVPLASPQEAQDQRVWVVAKHIVPKSSPQLLGGQSDFF